ncbi:MAG: AAA family ATPase [Caldilineaceae bacterium]|nr:AAA family ATPase [Caldilineaceae bacterium]
MVFRQEPILQRACAIRFVVGVNGTGKTRLLQALAQTLLGLERRQLPPFPVTLAYDLGAGSNRRTLLFIAPREGPDRAVLVEFAAKLPDDHTEEDWEHLAAIDWTGDAREDVRSVFRGNDLPGSAAMGAFLPRALLVYTSGATRSWEEVFADDGAAVDTAQLPEPGAEDDNAVEERPAGWLVQREIEYLRKLGNTKEASRLEESSQSVRQTTEVGSVGQLITADVLPLALCAVALQQMANEFSGEATQETLRSAVDTAVRDNQPMPGLRGLFNEVDWLWLESLHLRVESDKERLKSPAWRPFLPQLLKLYQLSATAIRQPEPDTTRLLNFDLFRPMPDDPDHLTYQGLFDVLCGGNGTALDAFRQLRDWQTIGLLRDVQMTVRRRNLDDLLLYDWLSDGERMFLGRMALFHLLAGADDALIILDEPETHFNDVWKRRIVDIIDDSLRDDASEVVISTHSSIMLTDAFGEEIGKLESRDGTSSVGLITTPTFGADPSEIMINVFDAPDSIGKRAIEYLDGLLQHEWKVEEREQLEKLIRNVGPGYYRSELRTIWRRLHAAHN